MLPFCSAIAGAFSAASEMVPYDFAPEGLIPAGPIGLAASGTSTRARSSAVIFSGSSLLLVAIAPLRLRGIRRSRLRLCAILGSRLHRRVAGKPQRLSCVRIDRNHNYSRQEIPGQHRTQQKNCQIGKNSENNIRETREFNVFAFIQIFKVVPSLYNALARSLFKLILRRFPIARRSVIAPVGASGQLPSPAIQKIDSLQPFQAITFPAEAALLVGMRVINPGDLLRRREKILVNERIVVGK